MYVGGCCYLVKQHKVDLSLLSSLLVIKEEGDAITWLVLGVCEKGMELGKGRGCMRSQTRIII